MFTGIITHTTSIISHKSHNDGLTLIFEKPSDWQDLELGESIATNGVCLTVSEINKNSYNCVLIPETLAVSTFGKKLPDNVNLERSLKVSDRLSGHIVQGHVDGIGYVQKITNQAGFELTISFDKSYNKYIAYKGTIIINGVALTVKNVNNDEFSVALVPYTLGHTTLGKLKTGEAVNLEFDIIGKYVAKSLEADSAKS